MVKIFPFVCCLLLAVSPVKAKNGFWFPVEVAGDDLTEIDTKRTSHPKKPDFEQLERIEQRAFEQLQSGQLKKSEIGFRSGIALFGSLQMQKPSEYAKHYSDKVELLEGLAESLKQQGRINEALKVSKMAKAATVKGSQFVVRTYSNGYSTGMFSLNCR